MNIILEQLKPDVFGLAEMFLRLDKKPKVAGL